MIDWLTQFNYWHWLALGLALLAVELLGTAGYFLWLGLSGLLVGMLMVFVPMGWQLQWMTFASFTLLTTWLWWRRQFKTDRISDSQRSLNQKEKQLIGQRIAITDDVKAGIITRIHLADSTWSAISDEDISAGSIIEIVELDGITLKIKLYQPVEK
ncbi:NfeD family protein [Vibrio cincinnatiensis]|uniref:NfeD family protein n=1 Tax=Vibrio cincinnatiensis TaxID=675 RepID=UPI0012ACFACB|nr:NfeD family protein [Vibrio cincinnatiensis]MCG3722467.1 NfeD family protein [Vibrio cincinnatiensis]MCG3758567.1 NfeD family protein [Vibrio cincinnatiensis]MCG3761803.1 NfeD family protein [Vibrio cincinnatiensis]